MSRFKDLTGMRYGKYTVLYEDFEREQQNLAEGKTKSTYWKCRCDCGREVSVVGSNLTTGKATKCRYCRDENKESPSNFIDLTGQKFGRLTVVGRENRQDGIKWVAYWKCICDCGNVCVVAGTKLTTGHTKSCGCLQKEKANATHFKDLTGKTFGFLYVESRNFERAKELGSKATYWNCRCVCGNRTVVDGGKLVSGHTKSCGCRGKGLKK